MGRRLLVISDADSRGLPPPTPTATRRCPVQRTYAQVLITLQAAGCTVKRTSFGGRASGIRTILAGSGFRPPTHGHPPDASFVEGYWDHPLQLRGLLFAPVIFDPASIGRGSFLTRQRSSLAPSS